jgi:hypothetical protein
MLTRNRDTSRQLLRLFCVPACSLVMLIAFVHDVDAPDEQVIDRANLRWVFSRVRHRMQDIAHGIQPGALFIVRLSHGLWRIRFIGMKEHRLFRTRISFPLVERCQVDGGQFPLFEGMYFAFIETATLFFPAD